MTSAFETESFDHIRRHDEQTVEEKGLARAHIAWNKAGDATIEKESKAKAAGACIEG